MERCLKQGLTLADGQVLIVRLLRQITCQPFVFTVFVRIYPKPQPVSDVVLYDDRLKPRNGLAEIVVRDLGFANLYNITSMVVSGIDCL